MFQYASLRGIAANRNFDWKIPSPHNYGDSNYGLFECFEMRSVKAENFGHLATRSLAAGQFHFNKELFEGCPDNVNLHDYFQSEKYFLSIEGIIRSDFTFKQPIKESCLKGITDLVDPIFLHVRRGDYVKQPENHPTCSVKYYQKSLEYFDATSPVLVFSDDIDWCKSLDLFSDKRFHFSKFNQKYNHTSDTCDGRIKSLIPYYDLCMMSLCRGGIMANSSLSWWGAWLIKNPTLPIIAPHQWFGKNHTHYDTKDLIPSRWIIQDS